jgi:hypothetical protein
MHIPLLCLFLIMGATLPCQGKSYWGICNTEPDQLFCNSLCLNDNCGTGMCIYGDYSNVCVCSGCPDQK